MKIRWSIGGIIASFIAGILVFAVYKDLGGPVNMWTMEQVPLAPVYLYLIVNAINTPRFKRKRTK